MGQIQYLSCDWKAVLSSRGGNLIQLKYRRKNFDLLHTPRPIHRELETPEKWGVSFVFAPLADFTVTDFELESYADGFGARYHHAREAEFDHTFELWLRYQFYPKIVRQSVWVKNYTSSAMPFFWAQYPFFRFPKESSVEITAENQNRFDHLSGNLERNAKNQPRPSGFCGAIFDHPSKHLRIAYMIDRQYSQWSLNFDKRRALFCAATQTNTPLSPGENRQLTTSIAISETFPAEKAFSQCDIR